MSVKFSYTDPQKTEFDLSIRGSLVARGEKIPPSEGKGFRGFMTDTLTMVGPCRTMKELKIRVEEAWNSTLDVRVEHAQNRLAVLAKEESNFSEDRVDSTLINERDVLEQIYALLQ